MRATVITYVNPAVAVAAGVTLLGEPFTAGTARRLRPHPGRLLARHQQARPAPQALRVPATDG